MNLLRLSIAFLSVVMLQAQTPVDIVRVTASSAERQVKLPAEILPYLNVPINAKVTGFVEKMDVDKGSIVRKGQVLAKLVAPEVDAQLAEVQSKAQAMELQWAEANAKLAGMRSTYEHLKAAAATPGVVAANDLTIAEKNVEAAQALVSAHERSFKASQSAVQAIKNMQQYLTITAPFDGVVTERWVHPGALVGPGAGAGSVSLFRLQQVSRLRLVVAVPEALVGGIVQGAHVPFHVPAFPGETFTGVISRIPHSLDEKTRTMSVELDVTNPGFKLAPGMYPEIVWPVHRTHPSLFVPPTSIVTTTERTFVIRVKDGAAEWVNVTRGPRAGDLVEVYGPLKEGDLIVRRGSDELREGTRVRSAPSK